ncbi:hypothetical protein HY375_02090 [Candidatus Berkelbacteria bacterium]|nr:hypothetical protein [Candidatus Berkelbacteria bacterium]
MHVAQAPYIHSLERALQCARHPEQLLRPFPDADPLWYVPLSGRYVPADTLHALNVEQVGEVEDAPAVVTVSVSFRPGQLVSRAWRDANKLELAFIAEHEERARSLGFTRFPVGRGAASVWRIQIAVVYDSIHRALEAFAGYIPDALMGELEVCKELALPGQFGTLGGLVERASGLAAELGKQAFDPASAVQLCRELYGLASALRSGRTPLKRQARTHFQAATVTGRLRAVREVSAGTTALIERMEVVLHQTEEYLKRAGDLCDYLYRLHAGLADLVGWMRIAHRELRQSPTLATARRVLAPAIEQYPGLRSQIYVDPYLTKLCWQKRCSDDSAYAFCRLAELQTWIDKEGETEERRVEWLRRALERAIPFCKRVGNLGRIPDAEEFARREAQLALANILF